MGVNGELGLTTLRDWPGSRHKDESTWHQCGNSVVEGNDNTTHILECLVSKQQP